jgi:hypothetical protein
VNLDPGGISTAQCQSSVSEPQFHGIAQRGKSDQFHFFTFEHSHVQKALHERSVSLERQDSPTLAGSKFVESRHSVTP